MFVDALVITGTTFVFEPLVYSARLACESKDENRGERFMRDCMALLMVSDEPCRLLPLPNIDIDVDVEYD